MQCPTLFITDMMISDLHKFVERLTTIYHICSEKVVSPTSPTFCAALAMSWLFSWHSTSYILSEMYFAGLFSYVDFHLSKYVQRDTKIYLTDSLKSHHRTWY